MMIRLDGTVVVAALSSSSPDSNNNTTDPPDSHSDYPRYRALHRRYHGDEACDRRAYNAFKRGLKRGLRKRALQYFDLPEDGDFPPTERTLHCPDVTDDSLPDWSVPEVGLDTTWIVENTAPFPVVIVMVRYGNGSAVVETPPHADSQYAVVDPRAIIRPGEYRALYDVMEGNVYRVRRLVLPQHVPGDRVLLQYRAGVRGVGGQGARVSADDCPDADDAEPPREDARVRRTDPRPDLKCHSVELGFRNLSPCPLNAYFSMNGTETFRFHLGTDDDDVRAVLRETWRSRTKFETSYVPHAYVFRNAQDETAVVDRYAVQPTRVTDCDDGGTTTTGHGGPDMIVLPTGEVIQGDADRV